MKRFLLLILFSSLAFNVYFAMTKLLVQNEPQINEAGTYPLLAKRIFLEDANDVIINFVPLRTKIREYIASKEEKIGLYFEYLPTGTSIGVNDREVFFRASLVKVPVVMSAYKLIEEGKLEKSNQLVIQEYHLDSAYGNLWEKGAGTTITVEEAIRLIIVESDNTAYEVLNEKVNDILDAAIGEEKNIANVYDYLDIPRDVEGLTQEITPRNYSSILRSLFFSAYLSYSDSNELLKLMSQSKYQEGIVNPLLGKVEVAHKFGIHDVEPDSLKVHSDCGIIYIPKRPYILCMMIASGEDVTSKHMQEISEIVYKFVTEVE